MDKNNCVCDNSHKEYVNLKEDISNELNSKVVVFKEYNTRGTLGQKDMLMRGLAHAKSLSTVFDYTLFTIVEEEVSKKLKLIKAINEFCGENKPELKFDNYNYEDLLFYSVGLLTTVENKCK